MQAQQSSRLTRSDVVIRPAESSDRAAVEYIASKTWDGNDYLSRVFDDWLHDTDGAFVVMTYRGVVVGLAKLSKLGADEWWMEGLRVHPEYQGRGLARIMHHYVVSQVRKLGEGVVRFSTSGRNEAILKLAAETGFRLVGEYARYEADVLTEADSNWRQLGIDDLESLRDWLDNDPYYHDTDHSFEHRWTWKLADDDLLLQVLQEARVYGWMQDNDELLGVVVFNPLRTDTTNDHSVLPVAFGNALRDHREAFWRAVRRLAARYDANMVRFKLLHLPEYTTPIVNAGWQATESHPVVFSRSLPMVDASQVLHTEPPAIE